MCFVVIVCSVINKNIVKVFSSSSLLEERERKNIYIVTVLLNSVRRIKMWLFFSVNNPISIFFLHFLFGKYCTWMVNVGVLVHGFVSWYFKLYYHVSCEWWIKFGVSLIFKLKSESIWIILSWAVSGRQSHWRHDYRVHLCVFII